MSWKDELGGLGYEMTMANLEIQSHNFLGKTEKTQTPSVTTTDS
jgi:hypothetical protein